MTLNWTRAGAAARRAHPADQPSRRRLAALGGPLPRIVLGPSGYGPDDDDRPVVQHFHLARLTRSRHSTPLSQQRRIHRALAAADDAGQHPDRVALHWGWLRAGGLDDAVAARLEQAAERAHVSAVGTRPRRRSCPVRLAVSGRAPARNAAARGSRSGAHRGSLDRAGALLDRAQAGSTTLAPRWLYLPVPPTCSAPATPRPRPSTS